MNGTLPVSINAEAPLSVGTWPWNGKGSRIGKYCIEFRNKRVVMTRMGVFNIRSDAEEALREVIAWKKAVCK